MQDKQKPRRSVMFGSAVVIAAVVQCVVCPSIAHGQTNTQRGATLGGLAGAVAGGIIGDNNDEAGAGAAIGGVLGAVTGGLLGNAKDKENVYRQQQYYLQQQQQAIQTQSSVSIPDVISMSRNGLSDNVIINQIRQRGVQQELLVQDIITLHQQGVREPVITAMQQSPTGVQRVVQAPQRVVERVITPAPVVVEEHHFVPHYPPPRIYYRHRPAVYRRGVHFRF